MTKQEYLSQIRVAQQQIRAIIAELESLCEQKSSISGAMDVDKVHSTDVSNRVQALAINIADRQIDLIATAQRLMLLQDEVGRVIDAVEDIRLRVLLRLRYITGLTWDRVAQTMYADVRTVYRWHEAALEAVRIPEA